MCCQGVLATSYVKEFCVQSALVLPIRSVNCSVKVSAKPMCCAKRSESGKVCCVRKCVAKTKTFCRSVLKVCCQTAGVACEVFCQSVLPIVRCAGNELFQRVLRPKCSSAANLFRELFCESVCQTDVLCQTFGIWNRVLRSKVC